MQLAGSFAFAADGGTETISSVAHTVSSTYAPANNSALYLPMGNVPRYTFSPNQKEIPVRGPINGQYQKLKTIITGYDPTITHTLTEWHEVSLQSVKGLAAAPTAGGGTAQPFVLGTPILGWLLLKTYDQTGVEVWEDILRVEYKVAQHQAAEGQITYEAMYNIFKNSLNTNALLSGFVAN
jgi:hypothetical protein